METNLELDNELEDAHLLAHPDWANDHTRPVK